MKRTLNIIFCFLFISSIFMPIIDKEKQIQIRYDGALNDSSENIFVENILSKEQIITFSNADEIRRTFAKRYFDHLGYFPQNIYMSCGYVALVMNFIYLDSFYNYRLVGDDYVEKMSFGYESGFYSLLNSPGHDYIDYGNSSSVLTYYNSMDSSSLQRVFFELAEGYNIIIKNDSNFYVQSNGQLNITYDAGEIFGTVMSERKELARLYLEGHPELAFYGEDEPDYNNYTIDTFGTDAIGDSSMDSGVSSIVANGLLRDPTYPWIVTIQDGIYHHACIAYYYDSENDEIYLHLGTRLANGAPNIVKVSRLSGFHNAMKISLSCDHECTTNYRVMGNSMYNYYCPYDNRFFY